MLSNENDSKLFFDLLVSIKDSINQQIPLAANRFEEFECPPDSENEDDVNIQFYMHEPLEMLMQLQYSAVDALKETYEAFISDNHIQTNTPLSPNDRNKLQQVLNSKTNAIYARLGLIWQLRSKKGISFEEAKPKLLEIIQSLLPGLCDHGIDALTLDEDQFIDLFLKGLQKNAKDIMDKILAEGVLDDNDMQLINHYCRKNVPHEFELTELVNSLLFNKQYPENKKTIDKKITQLFLEDVEYNIHALGEKLHARKFSYRARLQAEAKLADIREACASNMTTTSLDELLASYDFTPDKEISEKSLQHLGKINFLQRGLYFENHQCDTGFCDEHASLALVKLFLTQKVGTHRIEKVSISYSDGDGHVFVVVDRAKISELYAMSTWGEEAILLDPWHQLVCYAKDLHKQGLQYFSFPEGADWSSLEFSWKDQLLLRGLTDRNKCYVLTDNVDPEIREARVIEEYELEVIEQNCMLMSYLEHIVETHWSLDYKYQIKFYTFSVGNDLVKFIPGFRQPVVAIHQKTIEMLANRELSLSAFEFAIVNILLQLKMVTNFISPTSISHQMQQQLDIEAMEKINATEACLEYLRAAAKFSRENNQSCKTVSSYEREFGGFSLKNVTAFSYAERIKVLLASVASGLVNSFSKEVEYPSPMFQRALSPSFSSRTNSSPFFKITAPVKRPNVLPPNDKIIESVDNSIADLPPLDAENKSRQVDLRLASSEETKVTSDTQLSEAKIEESDNQLSIEAVIEDDSSEQIRITTLQQLIKQLPELKIELLPL